MTIRSMCVCTCVFALVACGDDSTGGNNQPGNNNNSQDLCGDGVLDSGEQCDDGTANSDVAPDACRTDCRFAYCGDGVIDNGEVCDTDDLDQATCQSESFTKGDISCDDQCQLVTSGCSTCGDDTAEGTDTAQTMYESCDGADLRSQDCVSVGQASGILACNTDCSWDFSLCLGGAVCQYDSECAGGQQICDNNQCRPCTIGECGAGRVCADGFCLAGDCYIDSQVWNENDTETANVCNTCKRGTSQSAWSPNGGQTCDDSIDCSYGDTCHMSVPGVCVGVSYTCPSLACSVGVCHGTGPADCTEEIQTSFNGCFIDGSCYNNNDAKPGNPCQRCDAANNAWAELAAGTTCGACQTCGVLGSEMDCLLVTAGQDPHNDCTDNCSVCNGVGGCQWTTAGTDPNSNCSPSAISTCGLTGDCLGGTNTCAYHTGGVGQVDDGNECTDSDYCDGAGNKAGVNVANATRLCGPTNDHVCINGACVACTDPAQCPASAPQCDGGSCKSGNCTSPSDCTTTPPQCWQNTCISNNCGTAPVAGACTLPDLCKLNETCQAGTCTEDSVVDCTNHGPSCTTASCNASTGACQMDYINGGQCLIGTCYANGVDNPGNECQECVSGTSQTAWTNKSDNTDCRVTSVCHDICRSGTCYNRFIATNCSIGGIGRACTRDRKFNKVYYEIGTNGCPRGTYSYDAGVAACTALGSGWQMISLGSLQGMDDGGTACTSQSCDGVAIAIDPELSLLDIANNQNYWARATSSLHYSVYFNSTGSHTTNENFWFAQNYPVICEQQL